MEVVRLHPDESSGWAMWPTFEARVVSFMERNFPELNQKATVYEMRNRWTSAPGLTGFWLVWYGHTPISHLAATAESRYGQNYIEVAQWEVDEGHNAMFSGVTQALLKELDSWAKRLNEALPGNHSKFTNVEFTTERHYKAWLEYLKHEGRVASKLRSVIQFGLRNPT
jgi:hypothetical protein